MIFTGLAKSKAHQPCAACRILRRRCNSNCLLAPFFPTDEIEKFVTVHKVFGASNVIKMVQMVEETNREDAVKAIVYEATARLRDPVYGSAGTIFQLQKMIEELKVQLDSIGAQVSDLQEKIDHLLSIHMNVLHLDVFSAMGDPMFEGDSTKAYDPCNFPAECDWIFQQHTTTEAFDLVEGRVAEDYA
ncbi:putative LOB domain-containing protein [Quillaja saponaria]|uniref:LOB domain-containing protein n=1 Tax=Quillaja saponaria TaxID=32244 RepID=A0AAD7PE03_QUISA|nr:putative LOB domain-containing protein [Quillaja saponaria]